MIDRTDPRMPRLKELIEQKAVLRGEFTLASGLKSKYYFDGRKVTHDPEGIALIGALVNEVLEQVEIEAVGGPATAANPIVTAVQIASFTKMQRPLQGFYIRGERKSHGTQNLIEGNLPRTKGARVAIVEDTVSTGGSLLAAIEAVEAAGCKVAKIVALVDRRQGGGDALRAKGYDYEALFEADSKGNIL
ncbi:MAG: orotate phosphoribosyltransferase [Chloroflexi bacterium]|nr:orotate phosphoribosyltransferase [Chloroflexota bacterium]